MKRDLLESSKNKWTTQYETSKIEVERKQMKKKADNLMDRAKKKSKSRKQKRILFQQEVRKQKELGNYYMVKVKINWYELQMHVICCCTCVRFMSTPLKRS